MKQREIVVDMVKAAFIVLAVKVVASSSVIMPWNSLVDNLCIMFAVCVMLVKVCKLTLALSKVIILCVISAVVLYSCVSLGQYDLMISLIAICLLIDEDIDAYIAVLLKTQALLVAAHIVLSIFLTLIGKGYLFWSTTGTRIRFSGGFVHPNVLSSYISSCMLMFAWVHFKQITTNKWGCMAAVMVLSYAMTKSRTGLLMHSIVLLLVYFAQREKTMLEKTINPVLLLLFPGLAVLTFWAQEHFLGNNPAALLLDEILTGRIKYAAYAYVRSGTTWLPRYLDYVAEGVVSWTQEWNLNTFTFDNLYSFMFMQMGMVWIAIFTVMIAVVCRKSDFKVKVFILMWVIYAMVEVHGLNCFKFYPILLLSTLSSKEETSDESAGNV